MLKGLCFSPDKRPMEEKGRLCFECSFYFHVSSFCVLFITLQNRERSLIYKSLHTGSFQTVPDETRGLHREFQELRGGWPAEAWPCTSQRDWI